MDKLVEILGSEIRNRGAITFARFMDQALYCPVYGYYEKEGDNIGRRGDYFTSVSVGPLFGELLGWQFSEWFRQALASGKNRLELIEAGAHKGELARDILRWFRQSRSHLLPQLRYWIVEPSAKRRTWQQETLADLHQQIGWVTQLAQIAQMPRGKPAPSADLGEPCRIIFSNELFDAMPVHRFGWDAQKGEWFEWGVTLRDEQFAWTRLPAGEGILGRVLDHLRLGKSDQEAWKQLLSVLPDGFTIEACPAAEAWWREAAGLVTCGKLMTIDYGLTTDKLFRPERVNGTLRTYSKHRSGHDLLAAPGEQDLTAHVNYSVLMQAGEAAGLRTDALVTQGRFLTQLAALAGPAEAGLWFSNAERKRQFQTLTHPEHLGSAFKVLIQSPREA